MKEEIDRLLSEYETTVRKQANEFQSFASMELAAQDYARRMETVMQTFAVEQLQEPALANSIECEDGVRAKFKGLEKKT